MRFNYNLCTIITDLIFTKYLYLFFNHEKKRGSLCINVPQVLSLQQQSHRLKDYILAA